LAWSSFLSGWRVWYSAISVGAAQCVLYDLIVLVRAEQHSDRWVLVRFAYGWTSLNAVETFGIQYRPFEQCAINLAGDFPHGPALAGSHAKIELTLLGYIW